MCGIHYNQCDLCRGCGYGFQLLRPVTFCPVLSCPVDRAVLDGDPPSLENWHSLEEMILVE